MISNNVKRAIFARYLETGATYRTLAKEFGLRENTIRYAVEYGRGWHDRHREGDPAPERKEKTGWNALSQAEQMLRLANLQKNML